MAQASTSSTFDFDRRLERGYHIRHTLQLALPVILSQLSHNAVQMADTLFVGNTGSADALATMTFANAVFVIALVTGIGLSMGLTPLVAQAMGQGREPSYVGRLLSNALGLNSLVAVLLMGLLFGAAELLPYFDQSPEVTRMARPVLRLLALSLWPVMIYQGCRQWMEGQGKPGLPMFVSIGGNVLNIILNWVLVYGHLGAPALGVEGSALATLIARTLMAAGMVGILFVLPEVRANLPKRLTLDAEPLKALFKMGVPISMQFGFEVGAFAYAAIMVGWIDAVTQSAHQVALQMASFTYMGASGIAAASSVRVGFYYGAKEARPLNLAANSAHGIGILYMSLAACVFLIFNHELPYLFFPDASVAEPAAILLLYASAFQIADGAQAVGLGILRGMGDVRYPTVIAAMAYWVVAIPIAYGLGFPAGWGVGGVWVGLTLGLFIAAIGLYGRFRRLELRWARGLVG